MNGGPQGEEKNMKGLSFSEPMVKAWMEGRKTVTRRLVKMVSRKGCVWCEGKKPYEWVEAGGDISGYDYSRPCRCISSPYRPGETVYIKETWADVSGKIKGAVYKATNPDQGYSWKSPRFMPEWATRSHALIVSVRPERVRDITEEEAMREGMNPTGFRSKTEGIAGYEHRLDFYTLWESLHSGSWERNDWVWRIELEKMK